MADFHSYYIGRLLLYEGGYASVEYAQKHNDKGGETYRGIARNFNPDWPGWKIIDDYKAKNGIPAWNSQINDDTLNAMAEELSKKNYWDALQLDSVQNQSVAELIMDFGFNSGLRTSAKAVQRIIGVDDDGAIGKITLAAINRFDQQELFTKLQDYRVQFIGNITTLSEDIKASLVKRAKSFTFTA